MPAEPNLDLVAHARDVLRAGVPLRAAARVEMIKAIGTQPDATASDRAIATHYLASRGIRG